MIKKIVVTLYLLLIWTIGFTQTRGTIDALKRQLSIAKDDTSRVKVLSDLCFAYRLGNTDSSLLYGQRALILSQKINYPAGEISALSNTGITMAQLGNLPKALEMTFKTLQIAKTNKLEHLTGSALTTIGYIFIVLKDYPKALYYLRMEKLNTGANEESFAFSQYDMGDAFCEMNQLDSAVYYERLAITNFSKENREEPLVYITLGNVEMKSGKPVEALHLYQKSLQISIKNNERRATAWAYNKLAAFYKTINQPDSAIYYASKGLEESKIIGQKNTIRESASLLSVLYESKDIKESLRYLKLADAYKDSLYSTGNLQAVQSLVAHEDERQKEIKAVQLAYRNQLREYAFLAGLCILLLIAFILYRNNQREKKGKKLLEEKNAVIEKALFDLKSTQNQLIQSEKMASLGELTAGIAHEIQNPLNFVNNFSEVSAELVDEMQTELKNGDKDEAIAISEDIKQNMGKIRHHGKRADAIVKGMLQHSQSGSGTKESTNVNALADEYMRLAYHGLRAKDKDFNTELLTHFDEKLPKVNVIPQDIGRVMLNLFNNAFYAVNQKSKNAGADFKPEVSVSTSSENGQVIIKVKDNGTGMSDAIKEKIMQPFFTTKPTGEGTGLGLSLTYDMVVKGHGGSIQVNSKEGEGSEFIISLPINTNS
jgi:signal transduction histidine kinase